MPLFKPKRNKAKQCFRSFCVDLIYCTLIKYIYSNFSAIRTHDLKSIRNMEIPYIVTLNIFKNATRIFSFLSTAGTWKPERIYTKLKIKLVSCHGLSLCESGQRLNLLLAPTTLLYFYIGPLVLVLEREREGIASKDFLSPS